MATIAQLGIEVRTDGVSKASNELDRLDKSSGKVEKQTTQAAAAMDRTALSAKQLAFATRGLPAQFTDIAVSLQAGQSPLQVLLQQGGQIKDTFGGAVPALRAVGGYIAGLINPLTLTAGAVVALGAAWLQAAGEGDAFNRALILTGNNARLTADELSAMAASLDDTTSATQGKAADVLAQVAATGRFTAEQIELVSRAAIQMEDATGKAIEETVKEFVALRGDPVNAILKLNEAQHFLTDETLEQIKTLKAQGREADAAAVAMRAYADTINDRAPKVVQSLGLMESAWRGIKKESAETWDGVLQGFRDADVAAKEGIDSIGRYLTALRSSGPARMFSFGSVGMPASEPPIVAAKASVDTETAKAKIKAEEEFARIVQGNLTREQALTAEIARIRETGRKAGIDAAKIEEQVAAARAKAATKDRPARRGAADPGTGILAQVRQQIALNEEAEKSEESLTASERLRIQVLDKLSDSHVKVTAASRSAIEAALTELETSDRALQQNKDLAAVYAEITEQSATATRNLFFERQRAAEANESLIESMQFELSLQGMSNIEREKAIALRQLEAGAIEEQRNAVAGLAEELSRTREQAALMDQFRGTLSDTFTDVITGAASAKDAFKSFIDSITEQLARAATDQLVQQLFGSFGTASGGAAGGNWFSQIAGIFAGGRAIGGPVSVGRMYEVGERGPEVLTMHGRNFLIPPAAGKVAPLTSPSGSDGRGVTVHQVIQVTGQVDRRSASQIATETGRNVRIATIRNGA